MAKAAWAALICVMLWGCSESPTGPERTDAKDVQAGEYYAFISGDGDYKVLKVLLVDDALVHVCYYNNVFPEKPAQDVIPSLYFGKKEFQDAFYSLKDGQQTNGRKHMALTSDNWEYWAPEFLADGQVVSEELQAYEHWKNGDRWVSGILMKPTN